MHNENPAAQSSRIWLFTERNKVVKKLLLIGSVMAQMFRMPLDRHAEGVAGQFDGFHSAIIGPGADSEAGTQLVHSLVMEAVAPDCFRKQGGKGSFRQNRNAMAALAPGFEIRVTFHMLVEGAA